MSAVSPVGADERIVFRSRPALRMGTAMSVVLTVFSLGLWVALGPELRQLFTGLQIATLVFFLAFGVGLMMSIGLSTVVVDDQGLHVRNSIFRRSFGWDEVAGARLGDGDPWAYIVLRPSAEHPDGRNHVALAIQRAEGEGAEANLRRLQRAIARHQEGRQVGGQGAL
ncbi:PH domain-containing protein [Luteococcus sp. OSA5]|uniref:PH domain-containing protein n=1 Tax=Luteococcus sp. OSA5 TaxID=3401630 RepID=UPI003B43BD60